MDAARFREHIVDVVQSYDAASSVELVDAISALLVAARRHAGVECERCNGTGRYLHRPCDLCQGSGEKPFRAKVG